MRPAYFHQAQFFLADGFNFFNQALGYFRIPIFIYMLQGHNIAPLMAHGSRHKAYGLIFSRVTIIFPLHLTPCAFGLIINGTNLVL
jgi:hypothetical protein